MVIASQLRGPKLMALAEMGCAHITISAELLRALSITIDTLPPPEITKTKHPHTEYTIPARLLESSRLEPLAPVDWDGVWASAFTDYLANDAQRLGLAIIVDAVVSRKMNDATNIFLAAETQVKGAIEAEIAGKVASAGAPNGP